MKNCRIFYILCALLWAILFAVLLCYDKAELHLMLSQRFVASMNTSYVVLSDVFFKYITEFGAAVPIIIGIIFLLFKFGWAYLILLAQIVVAVVVKIVKVAINAPRPKLFFQDNYPLEVLHQVDGVSMHSFYSFPSGHTAAVFALMLCLSFIANKKWASILFFIVALATGYSRIYLSQHFAEDVLAGSIVGVAMASLTYWLYSRKQYSWQKESLITVFRRNKK